MTVFFSIPFNDIREVWLPLPIIQNKLYIYLPLYARIILNQYHETSTIENRSTSEVSTTEIHV